MTLSHRSQRYVDEEKFLFSDENIAIDPVVRCVHVQLVVDVYVHHS